MSKILILILVLIFISHEKGITKKELDQKLMNFNQSPFVSILLVYDSVAPNTKHLLNLMDSIAEKRKGYYNVIQIDCNSDDKQVQEFVYCGQEYRKSLPALAFSEPSLNRGLNAEEGALTSVKQYQGPLDDKNLFNFAVPLMKAYSSELRTSRDFKKFEQSYKNLPKIIYFTDKQKIPPLYRALTANFRNTIVFGHVFSTSQLAKDLNITKFPIFLLNGKEKIEVKPNLTELIDRFDVIKGDDSQIFILDYGTENNVELTAANLDELVFKAPQHILIHVVGQDGNEHPEWANVTKKFSKMFKLYETFTLKQTLGVRQTPAIVYFPKSLAKKSIQKTIFGPRDSYEKIYEEIDSIIEDFTVAISNFMELQKLTSVHLQDEKFVAIFFHTKQIPLPYQVVSNDAEFQEEVAFFRMKDPDREVLQQYQIEKLPALIVMIVDKENQKAPTEKEKKQGRIGMNLKIAAFHGRFNYQQLRNFFRSFTTKSISAQPEQTYERDESSSKIQQIKKSNKLKKKCEEGCYLLFVNGNKDNESKNKNYLATLEKEAGKLVGGNFGVVDGVCHPELISVFEIQEDELPALVHVETKFERFSRMIGRLQTSSVSNFFGRVRSRKAMYRGYNKLEFENKDCQAEHQKLKKLSEPSSVIDQDEAAILEEIKAEQLKKREEFEQAQKGEKIRKKNKKRRPKAEEEQQL